ERNGALSQLNGLLLFFLQVVYRLGDGPEIGGTAEIRSGGLENVVAAVGGPSAAATGADVMPIREDGVQVRAVAAHFPDRRGVRIHVADAEADALAVWRK